MEKSLIKKVEDSGFKKKALAEKLGIVPNHLYQALKGNRNLSVEKEDALKQLLLNNAL